MSRLENEVFHVVGEDAEGNIVHEQDAKGRASLGGTLGFMLADCVRITAYTDFRNPVMKSVALRFDEDGFDL